MLVADLGAANRYSLAFPHHHGDGGRGLSPWCWRSSGMPRNAEEPFLPFAAVGRNSRALRNGRRWLRAGARCWA